MRTYVRAKIPGGTYFFTVNLAQRYNNTLLVDHVALLRDAFRVVRAAHPFTLEAVVILPDHLHCLWRLPANDDRYAMRWNRIKAHFSATIAKGECISTSRARKGERSIWQRRYWEHAIRDDQDWQGHLDYIHYNPVKHGHVLRACDWPHSSFHRFVRLGLYPLDWAAPRLLAGLHGE